MDYARNTETELQGQALKEVYLLHCTQQGVQALRSQPQVQALRHFSPRRLLWQKVPPGAGSSKRALLLFQQHTISRVPVKKKKKKSWALLPHMQRKRHIGQKLCALRSRMVGKRPWYWDTGSDGGQIAWGNSPWFNVHIYLKFDYERYLSPYGQLRKR